VPNARPVRGNTRAVAVTQIRYPYTDGRRYYERKRTEGKIPKEALRCLKRRLLAHDCMIWAPALSWSLDVLLFRFRRRSLIRVVPGGPPVLRCRSR
jgi:hypothetical protein